MIGAAVFAGAFALLFLGVALLDPRKLWWRFRARHFEIPQDHEPSTASFAVRRIILVCLAVFLGWQSVAMLRLAGVFETGADHAEILERVEHAALDLETGKGQGRYMLSGADGSWASFINPRLKGPERDDPVAVLVKDPWAPEAGSGSGGASDPEEYGSMPEISEREKKDRPRVERYGVDAICLTVTATALPGQPDRDYAIDHLMYEVETQVVDSPCE